jgi:serine/threonine protein kinase
MFNPKQAKPGHAAYNNNNNNNNLVNNSSTAPFVIVPGGEDGSPALVRGHLLDDRYEMTRLLGRGAFGVVVEAFDRLHKCAVAIKLTTKREVHVHEEFRNEQAILAYLSATSAPGQDLVAQLLDSFRTSHHLAMVFPRYGHSLFSQLQRTPDALSGTATVRGVAFQLLQAVQLLHAHGIHHGDIKPENVLLRSRQESGGLPLNRKDHQGTVEVVVCDFGSATKAGSYHRVNVGTAEYQSPEVLLKETWGAPHDMWSVGLVVLELFQGGVCLFERSASSRRRQFAKMQAVFGPCPASLVEAARSHDNLPRVILAKGVPTLDEMLRGADQGLQALIKGCLRMDPDRRLTAAEALALPFFKGLAGKPEVLMIDSETAMTPKDTTIPTAVPQRPQPPAMPSVSSVKFALEASGAPIAMPPRRATPRPPKLPSPTATTKSAVASRRNVKTPSTLNLACLDSEDVTAAADKASATGTTSTTSTTSSSSSSSSSSPAAAPVRLPPILPASNSNDSLVSMSSDGSASDYVVVRLSSTPPRPAQAQVPRGPMTDVDIDGRFHATPYAAPSVIKRLSEKMCEEIDRVKTLAGSALTREDFVKEVLRWYELRLEVTHGIKAHH